jgi:hypothetical protein
MTFPGYIRTHSPQTQSDGYFSRHEYVNMNRISTTQRPSRPWTTISVWCADNDSKNAWHFGKRKNKTVGVDFVQSNNQTVAVSRKMNKKDTERCEFCDFLVDCCVKSLPFSAKNRQRKGRQTSSGLVGNAALVVF